jgi:hypothetical protein
LHFGAPTPIDPSQVPTIFEQHLTGGQSIFNLVYKEYSQKKKFSNPGRFYGNLVKCLHQLKEIVVQRGLKEVAIPRMGSVHDNISWKFTVQKLKEIFKEVPVTFVVYSLPVVSGEAGRNAADGARKQIPASSLANKESQDAGSDEARRRVALGSAGGGCLLQPPQTTRQVPPSTASLARYATIAAKPASTTNAPPPEGTLSAFFHGLTSGDQRRAETTAQKGAVGGGGPSQPPPPEKSFVPHRHVHTPEVGAHLDVVGTSVSPVAELADSNLLTSFMEEQRELRKSIDALASKMTASPTPTPPKRDSMVTNRRTKNTVLAAKMPKK